MDSKTIYTNKHVHQFFHWEKLRRNRFMFSWTTRAWEILAKIVRAIRKIQDRGRGLWFFFNNYEYSFTWTNESNVFEIFRNRLKQTRSWVGRIRIIFFWRRIESGKMIEESLFGFEWFCEWFFSTFPQNLHIVWNFSKYRMKKVWFFQIK